MKTKVPKELKKVSVKPPPPPHRPPPTHWLTNSGGPPWWHVQNSIKPKNTLNPRNICGVSLDLELQTDEMKTKSVCWFFHHVAGELIWGDFPAQRVIDFHIIDHWTWLMDQTSSSWSPITMTRTPSSCWGVKSFLPFENGIQLNSSRPRTFGPVHTRCNEKNCFLRCVQCGRDLLSRTAYVTLPSLSSSLLLSLSSSWIASDPSSYPCPKVLLTCQSKALCAFITWHRWHSCTYQMSGFWEAWMATALISALVEHEAVGRPLPCATHKPLEERVTQCSLAPMATHLASPTQGMCSVMCDRAVWILKKNFPNQFLFVCLFCFVLFCLECHVFQLPFDLWVTSTHWASPSPSLLFPQLCHPDTHQSMNFYPNLDTKRAKKVAAVVLSWLSCVSFSQTSAKTIPTTAVALVRYLSVSCIARKNNPTFPISKRWLISLHKMQVGKQRIPARQNMSRDFTLDTERSPTASIPTPYCVLLPFQRVLIVPSPSADPDCTQESRMFISLPLKNKQILCQEKLIWMTFWWRHPGFWGREYRWVPLFPNAVNSKLRYVQSLFKTLFSIPHVLISPHC